MYGLFLSEIQNGGCPTSWKGHMSFILIQKRYSQHCCYMIVIVVVVIVIVVVVVVSIKISKCSQLLIVPVYHL